MKKRIDIGIADDHDLMREGYINMLKKYKHINVIFEARDGKELLACLQKFKPSIILLDIVMPVLDGEKAMKKIRQLYPKVKIIVVSGFSEDLSVVDYVVQGAHSFLPKNCNSQRLADAIYNVSKHGTYFEEPIRKLLAKNGITPMNKELSDREIFMLKLFCSNKTYSAIEAISGVAYHTVSWYKHQILEKTKCADIAELKEYAKKNQLIG